MGCCSSSEDLRSNTQVSKELNQDKKIDANVKKLLFLGSEEKANNNRHDVTSKKKKLKMWDIGGSGKSTLFKQLRTIHGQGFQDKDRQGFKDHIYSQIIEQMKELVNAFEDLKDEDPDKFGNLKISDEGQPAAEFMESVRGDMDVNDEVADAVELLWKEEAIKATFGERARLKVDDSSEYFFNEVRRIAVRGYVPTDKDILMVRHRTTGVVEQKFNIHGTTFHVFDVGGQRSERKKWIHCFERVTAVIFVASLAAYNEVSTWTNLYCVLFFLIGGSD
ncbi:guanine nucleotide binding protein (G protein), q polypeptide [Reticulomyxa filosa]|uniref:Guanine nucleotide binding protein (G protein), q polypeptide n=1 Tax=Reticulomyxa filosa TaxID=46433 RepID=X6PAJ3_RETFI|nr:guanine nucleotide binding protein (G protein), q polypeptide [Reticulomyxa filosa]|eukprot:ETO34667.1 guanine nucleotide binding protein (G protein), q polypeptide [Reticulomyxa filosa]